MLTIGALDAYGADTQAGLARCLNDETLYFALVEMLINDCRFEVLSAAVQATDVKRALYAAYALSGTASSLALTPLADQIEKMILCLQVQGDGAVLEKQLRFIEKGLEQLKRIDMEA